MAAHPEWSARRLKSVSIDGDGLLELRCLDIGTPIGAYFTCGEQVQPINIIDGRVKLHATVSGRLRLVYSVRQAYDYFNPIAYQALLDTVSWRSVERADHYCGVLGPIELHSNHG